ncbi:MAG: hypothetical protein V3U64_06330 [Cocleimonas sp.]
MKLSSATIGTLLFTAVGLAAFVLMAKRPAVDGNAMNFGMPASSATSTADSKVDTAVDVKTPEAVTPKTIATPAATSTPSPEVPSMPKTPEAPTLPAVNSEPVVAPVIPAAEPVKMDEVVTPPVVPVTAPNTAAPTGLFPTDNKFEDIPKIMPLDLPPIN